jgi:voltage-gated potassium channel
MNAWMNSPEKQALERERHESLRQLTEWLETPMVVLGFAWL